MDDQIDSSKTEKVKVNVGGTHFTTTRATLCSDPQSMLASMFSANSASIDNDNNDDSFFIDRNGRIFGYILDFLRIHELPPTLSDEDLFYLEKEAQYFRLVTLHQTVTQIMAKRKQQSSSKNRYLYQLCTVLANTRFFWNYAAQWMYHSMLKSKRLAPVKLRMLTKAIRK